MDPTKDYNNKAKDCLFKFFLNTVNSVLIKVAITPYRKTNYDHIIQFNTKKKQRQNLKSLLTPPYCTSREDEKVETSCAE